MERVVSILASNLYLVCAHTTNIRNIACRPHCLFSMSEYELNVAKNESEQCEFERNSLHHCHFSYRFSYSSSTLYTAPQQYVYNCLYR